MLGGTIGHFKVVSRLGRGGMGEVFAGEHESIQTKVAIKILHEDISQNHDHVQRFFNEAKIVGRIKHAGIVKIFDVGHHDGHAYLIMELLEGEPLSARIQRTGRLPWHDTAELGRQIASVLDATHRAGVIHRDLKPENIFLVQDHELAAGERVKILDFGISKLSGTMAGGSPKTLGTMGTPAYMAPEQWGESASVDWRADAYSLGCVLFEMATGRPPFIVNTVAGAYAQHLTSEPPPLRDLASVPEALHALVMRLLAKEPAERGTSIGAVARELAAIAGDTTAAVSAPDLVAATASGIAPTLASEPSRPLMSGRTTLGSSAAELTRTPVGPRPGRVWLIASGVVVVGVVATFAAMALRSPPDAPAVTARSTADAAQIESPPATPPPGVTSPRETLAEAKRAVAERRWADAVAALDAAGVTTSDAAKQLRAEAVVEAKAEQDSAAVASLTGDAIDLRAAERELAKIPATSMYRKSAEDSFAGARRRELQLDLDRVQSAATRADRCVTYARVLREIADREPLDLSRQVAREVSCSKAPSSTTPSEPAKAGSGSGSGSGFGGRV